MPTREDAYRLMTNHVKNENLQKHMLSVEAAMRAYAQKYGEQEKYIHQILMSQAEMH